MAWNQDNQQRVTVTSSVVGCIKGAKMLGTIATWLETIQVLRFKELNLSGIPQFNHVHERFRKSPVSACACRDF